MALKLAKFAVNTTPSEFLTWAKLTEGNIPLDGAKLMIVLTLSRLVYIDLEDYKNVNCTRAGFMQKFNMLTSFVGTVDIEFLSHVYLQ